MLASSFRKDQRFCLSTLHCVQCIKEPRYWGPTWRFNLSVPTMATVNGYPIPVFQLPGYYEYSSKVLLDQEARRRCTDLP